jgi:hypothetical protein
VLASGCGAMKKAKPAAEQAISDFHRQFNEQKFGDIYGGSHADFKAATTEKQFNDLLSAVHRKLGTVKISNTKTWNVATFNMTTRIMMVQDTDFDQGKGAENFAFRINGDKAVLLGYNINSSDLITK